MFGDGRIGRPGGRRAPLLAVAATAVGAPAATTPELATASGDLPPADANAKTAANARSADAAKSLASAKPGDAGKGDAKTFASAKPGDAAKIDAKSLAANPSGDAARNDSKPVAANKPGDAAKDYAKPIASAASRDNAASTFGSVDDDRPAEAAARPAKPQRAQAAAAPRKHTVGRGENAWTIAKRYGVRAADLLKRNGLAANAVLKPGQSLLIDSPAGKRK
nr:LysM domain-containing protein [Lysobacter enzymogenes]